LAEPDAEAETGEDGTDTLPAAERAASRARWTPLRAAPAAAPAATAAPAAQPAPAKTGGTVSLRFFFWTGSEEESKFWQEMAADASKAVGNVEVKFETDSFANFWTKLPADAASGTVADILGLQSLRTAGFTSRNLYLPLDDSIKDDKSFDLSDFDKTIVDGLSYKGKLYALSYDFGSHIVYVNKTLFQKAGVALPKPDWTWNDFVETGKGLSKKIDGNDVFGVVGANQFDRMVPWIFSNGGDYANADFTKSTLSAPETVEAFQFYADLSAKHFVAPSPEFKQANPIGFANGNVAMAQDGVWNLGRTNDAKINWGLAPQPMSKVPVSYGQYSGQSMTKLSKAKDPTWNWMKWASLGKEGQTYQYKVGLLQPTRKDLISLFVDDTAPPAKQYRQVFVDELSAELRLGRPIRAGYALGMRAEESRARAAKPVVERHRMTAKTLREVTTWLPIHHLKTDEVWKAHVDHGIPCHPAYELVGRLSCRACPLASRQDLIGSARVNGGLFEEYAEAEEHLGKPFKENFPLKRILQLARS